MTELKAGNLRMQYDQGFLRYIKLGEYEVLRMIYFALRDHNWDTMSGYLEDEIIHATEKSFVITYRWISSQPQFPFVWNVKIEGKENSEVIFSIRGNALQDVRKNRSGFCVLHSIKENAGGPCTIVKPSGEQEVGLFPKYISPHQPFFDIRQMEWPLDKKGKAVLYFKGDVFETEDQRNWSDDSFKTYCTPLSIPFPALLKKDQEIFQEIKLVVDSFEKADDTKINETCVLEPSLPVHDKPKIGIGGPSDKYFMSESEIEKIRHLDFDHYHIEIDFSIDDWHPIWLQRVKEAIAMQQDLEMFLIFSDNYLNEARLFANELDHLPAEMKACLLILHRDYKSTPAFLLDNVIPIFRKVERDYTIGAGTSAYFTELNRDRVKREGLDFVSYSVNPQVHAFDNASMTENAQAQIYTVESAIKYFEALSVHVSPITLKPRFNPNATAPEPAMKTQLPDAVDVRQTSLFGACWTLSSLVHLCASGVNLLTYYETVGWKGIAQGIREPAHPDLFPVKRDMLYPAFHIFQILLRNKAVSWIPFIASLPYSVVALGFREGASLKVLMANLHDTAIDTQLQYSGAKHKYFIWDHKNLPDSYFDSEFLDKNLESIPFTDQVFPRIKIGAHAIIYAQLLD